MKKRICCLFIILCTAITNVTKAQDAYHQHQSSVSLGYGVVNVWKVFLDKVVDIPGYKVKSTGPLTLIYEYGILQRFSLGLAAGYSRVNGKAEKYQIADQITFLSLLARANYHIWTSAKFDPYFGGGIGINNSKYKNKDPHTIIDYANSSVPSTIDFSVQAGLKYYPMQHIAFTAEAGYINGAIMLFGLTWRL